MTQWAVLVPNLVQLTFSFLSLAVTATFDLQDDEGSFLCRIVLPPLCTGCVYVKMSIKSLRMKCKCKSF